MENAYLSSLGFLGEYNPRLDEKGRLILPARFRPAFTSGLVMTSGQERCLYVFTIEEFRSRLQDLRSTSYGSKQLRDFTRMFLSSAIEETPDKQGRISIPANLRAYAKLDRDLTVIGVGTHAEIWDQDTWNAYREENTDAYSASSLEVFGPPSS